MRELNELEQKVVNLCQYYGEAYSCEETKAVNLDGLYRDYHILNVEFEQDKTSQELKRLFYDLGIYMEMSKLEFEGNKLTTTPSNLVDMRRIKTKVIPIQEMLKNKRSNVKMYIEGRVREYYNSIESENNAQTTTSPIPEKTIPPRLTNLKLINKTNLNIMAIYLSGGIIIGYLLNLGIITLYNHLIDK